MMRVSKSTRARGGNRGGMGGGYEITDPDWEEKRLKRLKTEYASLTTDHHRELYLSGLSRFERQAILRK